MNALTTLRNTALRRNAPEEDENERTLLGQAVHTALIPLRIATSRPAIKVYLTTFLFFFTSLVLISVSTTAYLLFYYNYIPQIGLTQTIYLQYDANVHPHATIAIDTSALVTQQPYDISVSLQMPRTPANVAAGNFMIDLSLLPDPTSAASALSYILNTTDSSSPLARSRRPAILPYSSPITSLSHKILHLPIHLLSFKDLDSSVLKISMFERLSFPRGRTNLPKSAYLEIQSQLPPAGCPPSSAQQQPVIGFHLLSSSHSTSSTPSSIQIYTAQLNFHARFEGLRYYVYNYRILSFLIFSSLFYTFAVSSMAIAWAFVTAVISARNPSSTLPDKSTRGRLKLEDTSPSSSTGTGIKKEEDRSRMRLSDIKPEPHDSDNDLPAGHQLDAQALAGLSSTERTFPTLGRNAQPLRYTPSSTTAPSDDAESSWLVQQDQGGDDMTHDAEDEDDNDIDGSGRGREAGLGIGITPLHAPGDIKDEDDDAGSYRDSGIGTSMESDVRGSGSAGGGSLRRRTSSRGGSRGGNSGARQ